VRPGHDAVAALRRSVVGASGLTIIGVDGHGTAMIMLV
jgi:hypothetical protein